MAKESSLEKSDSKAPFRGFGGKNPYKKGGMFEGASHIIFTNAKHLRKNMTDAETALWMHLKKGINGFKIRRQHPIGIYIADFFCHKVKLIIEVDGMIHRKEEIEMLDKRREKELIGWGCSLVRFTNEEVLKTPGSVISRITEKILELNISTKQNTLPTTESKSPL
jgi:very-short-patch-repair endonuclease